jgi:biopolymer transport protein ExbD
MLRRSPAPEPRIELIPLIDVLMFLLTFFLVSMTLAVRLEVMPMELRPYVSGETAKPRPAITVSLALDGAVYVDREPMELSAALESIVGRVSADPETVVYLAVAEGEGSVDRAPILQDLLDRLKDGGVSVSLVGRPREAPQEPPGP